MGNNSLEKMEKSNWAINSSPSIKHLEWLAVVYYEGFQFLYSCCNYKVYGTLGSIFLTESGAIIRRNVYIWVQTYYSNLRSSPLCSRQPKNNKGAQEGRNHELICCWKGNKRRFKSKLIRVTFHQIKAEKRVFFL